MSKDAPTLRNLCALIQADQEDYPSSSTLSYICQLIEHGYDYYDIMRTIINGNLVGCSEDAVEILCSLVPRSRKLKSLSANNIHGMIARWTATKYHTGPIREVVQDIQSKCLARNVGLTIYNSNLNPNNPRAANDPYILMITKKEMKFLDLNRKISYQYTYESERAPHDKIGYMR